MKVKGQIHVLIKKIHVKQLLIVTIKMFNENKMRMKNTLKKHMGLAWYSEIFKFTSTAYSLKLT